jgi:hypothetical protein
MQQPLRILPSRWLPVLGECLLQVLVKRRQQLPMLQIGFGDSGLTRAFH